MSELNEPKHTGDQTTAGKYTHMGLDVSEDSSYTGTINWISEMYHNQEIAKKDKKIINLMQDIKTLVNKIDELNNKLDIT